MVNHSDEAVCNPVSRGLLAFLLNQSPHFRRSNPDPSSAAPGWGPPLGPALHKLPGDPISSGGPHCYTHVLQKKQAVALLGIPSQLYTSMLRSKCHPVRNSFLFDEFLMYLDIDFPHQLIPRVRDRRSTSRSKGASGLGRAETRQPIWWETKAERVRARSSISHPGLFSEDKTRSLSNPSHPNFASSGIRQHRHNLWGLRFQVKHARVPCAVSGTYWDR